MAGLLKVPNPILRTPCKLVKTIGPKTMLIAKELTDYMLAHREDEVAPIGLAAPQLGHSIQVIAFYPNPSYREDNGVEVLINPELHSLKKFVFLRETCLSIPGRAYRVKRANRLKLKGLNLGGQRKTYKARGLLAQIAQHEVDHLNGVLVDKAGSLIV